MDDESDSGLGGVEDTEKSDTTRAVEDESDFLPGIPAEPDISEDLGGPLHILHDEIEKDDDKPTEDCCLYFHNVEKVSKDINMLPKKPTKEQVEQVCWENNIDEAAFWRHSKTLAPECARSTLRVNIFPSPDQKAANFMTLVCAYLSMLGASFLLNDILTQVFFSLLLHSLHFVACN